MGKKGGSSGSSWLTAVKRAFRSPTKESSADKQQRTSRRRGQDHDQEVDDDEEKKREKRRWIFRKPTSHESTTTATTPIQPQIQTPPPPPTADKSSAAAAAVEEKHAITVAEAPVEVARLARPNYYQAREHYAAIVIQTSFRGYLARRALRALKGLVKLQALVRGHNVRKQAKMTLRCMQALVRVQARILDQRMRLSHEEGSSRKSTTFSDTTSLIESRYLQDLSDRQSSMGKTWRNGRRSPSVGSDAELDRRPPHPQQWLDRWMAAKPWDSSGSRARASTDHRDPIKTVEMDTSSQPSTYRRPPPSNQTHHQRPSASPIRRSHHTPQTPSFHHHHQHQSPTAAVTPSPSRTRPVQVRSASPRSCVREDYRSSSSQTPSLRSNYHYTGNLLNHQQHGGLIRSSYSSAAAVAAAGPLPNYMAATESARARSRSQSAPRQRPSTPERGDGGGNRGTTGAGGCAKKRLSFPVPADSYSGSGQYPLRSPSFKSVSSTAYYGGLEQQSNYSSCYTESVIGGGGEVSVSPTSTGDLRRWFR